MARMAFAGFMFDTRVRYSGSSVSYALAGVLGAALAPLISVHLLAWTGASWSVSLYLFAMALISFVAVLLLSQTYRSDLSAFGKEASVLADGYRDS